MHRLLEKPYNVDDLNRYNLKATKLYAMMRKCMTPEDLEDSLATTTSVLELLPLKAKEAFVDEQIATLLRVAEEHGYDLH